MADRDKLIRLFQRAGDQRLTTAEFLLEHEFYLDALYLAGYAVECPLKGLIVRRTPRTGFAAMYQRLTGAGAKGHDFEFLRGILKQQARREGRRGEDPLEGLAVHAKDLFTWSTDLRYQTVEIHPRDADRFFKAVRAVCATCARS